MKFYCTKFTDPTGDSYEQFPYECFTTKAKALSAKKDWEQRSGEEEVSIGMFNYYEYTAEIVIINVKPNKAGILYALNYS